MSNVSRNWLDGRYEYSPPPKHPPAEHPPAEHPPARDHVQDHDDDDNATTVAGDNNFDPGDDFDAWQAEQGATNGIEDAPERRPADDMPGSGSATEYAIAALPADLVTNRVTIATEDDDSDTGKQKKISVPLRMSEIIDRTRQQTGDWPRRVDNVLFVDDATHGVSHLEKPQALFGWLHTTVGRVQWHGGNSVVKQTELFAELGRTATAYENVEAYPHEPPLQGHYYACPMPKSGDGSRLRELVNRFAPATLVDSDLILSAFVTPGWGGPPGCRPCYVVTSKFGRGVGKSTLAEMVGQLWGGVLSFSHHEDISKIKTRLLTPNAMTKRVALLDNVKSLKFSWAELEHLITATAIDGHRLFHGNGTRPNSLTWFVTLNGASLSTDLAQRSVIIELDKPKRSATWLDDTRQFIERHRAELLADVVGILRSTPSDLHKFSRWATWEREVLARMPEPGDCQAVIAERQDSVDVEGEEAETIQEEFERRLRSLRYDTDREWIFIPSRIANQWYCHATNDRATTTQSTRILKQMSTEGRLPRIQENRRGDTGRGFRWVSDIHQTSVALDIEERIAEQQREKERNQRWD